MPCIVGSSSARTFAPLPASRSPSQPPPLLGHVYHGRPLPRKPPPPPRKPLLPALMFCARGSRPQALAWHAAACVPGFRPPTGCQLPAVALLAARPAARLRGPRSPRMAHRPFYPPFPIAPSPIPLSPRGGVLAFCSPCVPPCSPDLHGTLLPSLSFSPSIICRLPHAGPRHCLECKSAWRNRGKGWMGGPGGQGVGFKALEGFARHGSQKAAHPCPGGHALLHSEDFRIVAGHET